MIICSIETLLLLFLPFSSILSAVEGRRNIDEPVFFVCDNGRKLLYEEFCDGFADCSEGEDENSTLTTGQDLYQCVNRDNDHGGFCAVSRDQVCGSKVVCSNLSPCDLNCQSHYRCNNGTCLQRTTVCDQDPCSGCDEDHGWKNGVGFKCARNGFACVLPQQLLRDNVSDCDNGADLCFPAAAGAPGQLEFASEKCFRCLSSDMIISISSVCDGIIDCSDLSDECACATGAPDICRQVVTEINEVKDARLFESNSEESPCEAGEIRCKNQKCIETSSVCDGILDCGEDERFDICRGTIACKDSTAVEECRCNLDRRESHCRAVSATACDGIGQCPPPQLHGWDVWTQESFPEDECNATCSFNTSPFRCEVAPSRHYRTKLSGTWCIIPDNIERPAAYTREIEGWKYCDGIIDCELSGSDEDECEERFHCNTTKAGYVSIRKDQVCDGLIDCADGKDESAERCSGENSLGRFLCPALGGNMVSIDASFQCDSIINCDDARDEEDCDDGRFYCENGEGPLFVSKNQFRDGKADCSDWSDECPTVDGSNGQDAFSSRDEMIENPWLRVMVWIMGLLSIVGNSWYMRAARRLSEPRLGIIAFNSLKYALPLVINWIVIVHESSKLRRPGRKTTPAIRANRVLILNLACSDFLMGVYLVSLGSIAVQMEGEYCSKYIEWRTSSFCVSLGILSVISSETSVMTMVILTGCRLYAILRPFRSSAVPSMRSVMCLVCVTWATSLTLALLPLSSSLAHFFVAGVDFVFNPFVTGTQVSLNSAKDVFSVVASHYLWNASQHGDLDSFLDGATWKSLQNKGNAIGVEYFEPKTLWGYYSAASVCIPKFFISTSDPAWVFSLVVNLFNFLAFAFVAVSYVLIYVSSRRNPATIRNRDVERKLMRKMQRKILRLVATDFCCWVPICVMAFVKLAGCHVANTAFAFAAVILLPLNSALNPILYSDILDTVTQRTMGAVTTWISSLSRSDSATSNNNKPAYDDLQLDDLKAVPDCPAQKDVEDGEIMQDTPLAVKVEATGEVGDD